VENELLSNLLNDPDGFWILYDLCIINNHAIPEMYTIPNFLYYDIRHRVNPVHAASRSGHSVMSLSGKYAVSRVGARTERGLFGSVFIKAL
jgi:hypothetical protein